MSLRPGLSLTAPRRFHNQTAGYLRDLGWPHGGGIEITQGEDMGVPSRLLVKLTEERGASVRVSGDARLMLPDS